VIYNAQAFIHCLIKGSKIVSNKECPAITPKRIKISQQCRMRRKRSSKLYYRPRRSWNYQGVEDEYSAFPEYRPIPGAPGTTPATSEPEDNPIEELPDAHTIVFPHFQEIDYHVKWGPNHDAFLDYDDLLQGFGHWGEDEEEDADEKPKKRTKLGKSKTTKKKTTKKSKKDQIEADPSTLLSGDGDLLESALGLSNSPTKPLTTLIDADNDSSSADDDDDFETPQIRGIVNTNNDEYDGTNSGYDDDDDTELKAADFF